MYYDSLLLSKDTPEKEVVKLGGNCKCERCSHGCKFGSGAIKEGHHKKIAKFLNISVEKLETDFLEEVEMFNTKLFRPKILKEDNNLYGNCIFLENGECKIHKVKPLQCKTSSGHSNGEQLHTWFILNHFVNSDDPESIRQYAAYLKGNKTIPGGALLELVPNKMKLRKILNYEILR